MFIRNRLVILLCFVLFISLLKPPPLTYANNGTASIKADLINVREGPGLSYRVVSKVKKGDTLPLVKEEGDWLLVEVSSGKSGWVANWLVSKTSNPSVSNNSSNITVATNGLRVRSGPGTGFSVIGTLSNGAVLQVLEQDGTWIKVKIPSGDGWVAKEFVQITPGNEVSQKKNSTSIKGVITADSLNVRSSPSMQSEIIGKLTNGETIHILSEQGTWVEIQYSGKKAWINGEFVKKETNSTQNLDENKVNKPVESKPSKPVGVVGTVTANQINVREIGSLNGKVIEQVKKGQTFKIVEELNSWAKIEIKPGVYGWVAGWYLDKSIPKDSSSKEQINKSSVTILHNGTNIRKGASSQTGVVQIANSGDTFPVISLHDDWYEVNLGNGLTGFVAGWIVSVNGPAPQVEKPGAEMYLKNKIIVIDPGHGGRDNGATGAKGTLEKTLTLRTGELIYRKLKSAGAKVVMTRSNDSYLSLGSRAGISNYHGADAFISIHYDSILDSSVRGMTSYYYHGFQKTLATTIHASIVAQTKIKDRGARFGDYHVLRENNRNGVLLELGYLSNPIEETLIVSDQYQEKVATGVYLGLAKYFKEN